MPAVMLGVFALTLFCSASLLFLVEPMIGKMMLPLLGGTPAVWNTCMVFFQAVLLAGYGYAHVSTAWLGPRKQAGLHLGVLVLPLLFFAVNGPLAVNKDLIAGREGNPIPALLLVLTLSVGLPMFVVCTSAPILQKWFASTDHPAARDPYFLYGASNLGSMLALVAYPALVERLITLNGQRVYWAFGYAGLAALTAACAYLMWKSRPAAVPEVAGSASHPAPAPATAAAPNPEAIRADRGGVTTREKTRRRDERTTTAPAPAEPPLPTVSEAPVTWLRRLRWITLALVPSSLMLGATTFITTDIAAIPLLWVLPLALYLLTFIIVFAHIAPRTQSFVVFGATVSLIAATAYWLVPVFFKTDAYVWILRVIAIGLIALCFPILRWRDPHLIHRCMIMVMPLLVLLLLFLVLSEIKPGEGTTGVLANIALHLTTLFVVSMVCHGELARDRPATRHLTEYFLWMSFGGVVGGLFNALVAPLAFNGIFEYQMVMMVACLMLPPLGTAARENVWARRADVALAGVFLAVGLLLLFLFRRDPAAIPEMEDVRRAPWAWAVVGLCGGLLLGAAAWRTRWGLAPPPDGGEPENDPIDRLLDLALPLALMVLVVGLFWGLPSKDVKGRLAGFAELLRLDQLQFRTILTFGLPAVLCYTFVERSVRFGLGVGAILLAAGMCTNIRDAVVFQDRSFFGVLKVEQWASWTEGYRYEFNRLVHGTTLHGKQFTEDGLRDYPLTYYHTTGPVGQVFRAYNTSPDKRVAVIGLGTGSMAAYGLKGQKCDFYDIDPVVRDIAFESDKYFTYVSDAKARGVDMRLILGDARLTMDRIELPRGDEYNLIVVDAFSSDAIPVHLITREAVQVYLRKLLPEGILCFHISNRYLDLHPVLANIAEKEGLVGLHMSDDDSAAAGKNRSHWVALARAAEGKDPLAHLAKLRNPVRWERDPNQLALLGVAAFSPRPAAGLAYAVQGLVDRDVARKEKETKKPAFPTAWKPLETLDELTRQFDQEEDTRAKAELGRKITMTKKVGVWTDDYSNLLSVFGW